MRCEFGLMKVDLRKQFRQPKNADHIVLVLGGKSGLAPDCTTGEFRDTTDLGLPGVQEKLALQIMDLGKPVVLVLLNGRPASIPTLVERAAAVLEAWVPGEEGARAVAKAIFGEVNPGGKLPSNHRPFSRTSSTILQLQTIRDAFEYLRRLFQRTG